MNNIFSRGLLFVYLLLQLLHATSPAAAAIPIAESLIAADTPVVTSPGLALSPELRPETGEGRGGWAAIAAFSAGLIGLAPVAILFGWIGKSAGRKRRRLANAGFILGWVYLLPFLLILVHILLV